MIWLIVWILLILYWALVYSLNVFVLGVRATIDWIWFVHDIIDGYDFWDVWIECIHPYRNLLWISSIDLIIVVIMMFFEWLRNQWYWIDCRIGIWVVFLVVVFYLFVFWVDIVMIELFVVFDWVVECMYYVWVYVDRYWVDWFCDWSLDNWWHRLVPYWEWVFEWMQFMFDDGRRQWFVVFVSCWLMIDYWA